MSGARLTAAGIVVAAQGVKGLVRVKTFTATPGTLDAYGPLTDAAGAARYDVTVVEVRDAVAIARIDGVHDRSAAERLKGMTLYLDRAVLPEPDDGEYLHADLIGLTAEVEAVGRIGVVAAMHDFGAGDLIEIDLDAGGAPLVLPFTAAAAPDIDIKGGRIRVVPPPGLWAPPESGQNEA